MQMIRERLAEVLGKYGVKIADAPLDALTLAVEHILRAARPETPQLGLATTGQLIDEITARIEIHAIGGLEYRTVDAEKFAAKKGVAELAN